jgi:hypothetical protein
VNSLDLDVRRHVYSSILASGRAPTTFETARALALPEPEIADAYRRLHDAHALVLFPGSTEVRMANPFCLEPTPHRVKAGGNTWNGTCCWDALGILAALHADGEIDTECACCAEPLRLVVCNGELAEGDDVICHILVPARNWWDDIVFT